MKKGLVNLFFISDENFTSLRKKSIKDEFSLVKDFMKSKNFQEDLDTDDQDEIIKNTHLNEVVGKYHDEDDEDENSF